MKKSGENQFMVTSNNFSHEQGVRYSNSIYEYIVSVSRQNKKVDKTIIIDSAILCLCSILGEIIILVLVSTSQRAIGMEAAKKLCNYFKTYQKIDEMTKKYIFINQILEDFLYTRELNIMKAFPFKVQTGEKVNQFSSKQLADCEVFNSFLGMAPQRDNRERNAIANIPMKYWVKTEKNIQRIKVTLRSSKDLSISTSVQQGKPSVQQKYKNSIEQQRNLFYRYAFKLTTKVAAQPKRPPTSYQQVSMIPKNQMKIDSISSKDVYGPTHKKNNSVSTQYSNYQKEAITSNVSTQNTSNVAIVDLLNMEFFSTSTPTQPQHQQQQQQQQQRPPLPKQNVQLQQPYYQQNIQPKPPVQQENQPGCLDLLDMSDDDDDIPTLNLQTNKQGQQNGQINSNITPQTQAPQINNYHNNTNNINLLNNYNNTANNMNHNIGNNMNNTNGNNMNNGKNQQTDVNNNSYKNVTPQPPSLQSQQSSRLTSIFGNKQLPQPQQPPNPQNLNNQQNQQRPSLTQINTNNTMNNQSNLSAPKQPVQGQQQFNFVGQNQTQIHIIEKLQILQKDNNFPQGFQLNGQIYIQGDFKDDVILIELKGKNWAPNCIKHRSNPNSTFEYRTNSDNTAYQIKVGKNSISQQKPIIDLLMNCQMFLKAQQIPIFFIYQYETSNQQITFKFQYMVNKNWIHPLSEIEFHIVLDDRLIFSDMQHNPTANSYQNKTLLWKTQKLNTNSKGNLVLTLQGINLPPQDILKYIRLSLKSDSVLTELDAYMTVCTPGRQVFQSQKKMHIEYKILPNSK